MKNSPEIKQIIEEYVIRRCREDNWSNDVATETANKIVAQITDLIERKDYGELIDWLHSGNKFSKKVFSALTGRKLPPTNKGTALVIREFVGEEKYQVFLNIKKNDAALRAEQKENEQLKELTRKLSALKYIRDGEILTSKELMDRLINDGYVLREDKRGAVNHYSLANNEGSTPLTSDETKYVRLTLSRRDGI